MNKKYLCPVVAGLIICGAPLYAQSLPPEAPSPGATATPAVPAKPSAKPAATTKSPDKTEVFELDDTIVTAEKRKARRKETAASVEVIRKEDLQRVNARNFDDVIRLLPGITVSRPANQGIVTPQSINIRGIQGPDRTLILVDGVRVNNGANDFINLNTIPVDSIERVEVVKAGNSALYGTNALGGVINIITKTGSGLKPGEHRVGIRTEVGGYGYRRLGINAEGAGDGVRFSVGYENQHGDNYLFRDTAQDTLTLTDPLTETKLLGQTGDGRSDTKLVERQAANLGYDSNRYNFRLVADLSDRETLDFLGSYSENRTGVQDSRNINSLSVYPNNPVPRLVLPPNTIQDANILFQQSLFGIKYNNQLNEDWLLTARLGHTRQYQDFRDESFSGQIPFRLSVPPPRGITVNLPRFSPTSRASRSSVLDGEIQVTGKISPQHSLVAGVQYLGREANWGTFDRDTGAPLLGSGPVGASDQNIAAFVQDTWKIGDQTDLVLGLRYDSNSLFGSAFSPKLGLLHRIDDTFRLRANASRSFRAPSLNQAYEPDFVFAPFNVFRSNPNLRPEYVNSYEIGLEKDLSKEFQIYGTAFRNDQTDLITTSVSTIEPRGNFAIGVRRYDNLSAVTANGVEFGLRGRLGDHWSTQLSYTYLNARLTQDGPFDATTNAPSFRAGSRLEGSAFHNGALTVGYQSGVGVGEFSLAATARARSEVFEQNFALRRVQEIPGYVVYDLNVEYQLFDQGRIFVTAYNLFDRNYQEQSTQFAPGRQLFGGLQLDF